ncbi:hypothetical protein CDL12_02324 [Handroanthus impetiginosus]|uniref:Uncharacterized protein n=1 Tax=Handroanthus impetiginosus TaxID=429701 RepID=A0A2G9I5B8_9LAMI|nr:hypothetical protein CDL12_02324 [Handroanthus impetiginosus]
MASSKLSIISSLLPHFHHNSMTLFFSLPIQPTPSQSSKIKPRKRKKKRKVLHKMKNNKIAYSNCFIREEDQNPTFQF